MFNLPSRLYSSLLRLLWITVLHLNSWFHHWLNLHMLMMNLYPALRFLFTTYRMPYLVIVLIMLHMLLNMEWNDMSRWLSLSRLLYCYVMIFKKQSAMWFTSICFSSWRSLYFLFWFVSCYYGWHLCRHEFNTMLVSSWTFSSMLWPSSIANCLFRCLFIWWCDIIVSILFGISFSFVIFLSISINLLHGLHLGLKCRCLNRSIIWYLAGRISIWISTIVWIHIEFEYSIINGLLFGRLN